VARVADIPTGTLRPFTAGAVQGYLVNQGGRFRALSRLCTDMGCALAFHADDQRLSCPCHGAEFGLDGRPLFNPFHGQVSLSPLPQIEVRVQGETVQVWGA
jgi:cytochrome b6-f complex iron-sulfur subunit